MIIYVSVCGNQREKMAPRPVCSVWGPAEAGEIIPTFSSMSR